MSEEVTPRPIFKPGDECLDKELRKYRYAAKVEGYGHLVQPYVMAERYVSEEGDFQLETVIGPEVLITGELYRSAQAVVAMEMDRVDELRKECDRYRKLRSEAVVALRKTEQENAERADNISARHAVLKHIEDILDRKPLFIADFNKLRVLGPDEAEKMLADVDPDYRYSNRGRKPKRKLLMLWGDADGDLEWRISNYSDGSGYSCVLSFHDTEEAAYAAIDVRAEGTILGAEFKENSTYVGYEFTHAAAYLMSRTGRLMSRHVYAKIVHGATITHTARMIREADMEAARKRAQLFSDAKDKAAEYLVTLYGPLATLVDKSSIPDTVLKMFLPEDFFDEPAAGSDVSPMPAKRKR